MSTVPVYLHDVSVQKLECNDVVKILESKSFWTEYEPVVDVKSGKIFGYEALARFVHHGKNLPPAPVFELTHHDTTLFFELEKTLKKMQIAHRPKCGLLFINIDPHNFIGAQKNDY
jgi:EAL domain-containing protein (putative c-di-GMP-specific phosphodiesterase class I)